LFPPNAFWSKSYNGRLEGGPTAFLFSLDVGQSINWYMELTHDGMTMEGIKREGGGRVAKARPQRPLSPAAVPLHATILTFGIGPTESPPSSLKIASLRIKVHTCAPTTPHRLSTENRVSRGRRVENRHRRKDGTWTGVLEWCTLSLMRSPGCWTRPCQTENIEKGTGCGDRSGEILYPMGGSSKTKRRAQPAPGSSWPVAG
jgi:hypothetical protein